MINRTHLLILLLAVGGAVGGLFAGRWLRPAGPESDTASTQLIGNPRPRLDLPDLDGRRQSLAQWDGRLILLNFWASWCTPCIEEMPLLERTQQRLGNRGLQVIGIAADGAEATRRFLQAHPVSYPILVDDPEIFSVRGGRDVSIDYGNSRNVLPYSVLIGRDGRILAQRFGNFTETSLEQWLTPHL
jgi:thiol-disulfide isomerase/thioredoxin